MAKYPEDVAAYLAEHWAEQTNDELVENVRRLFSYPLTMGAANSYGSNHHLRKNPGVRNRSLRKYTDEQLDWLREFIPGHGENEIIDAYDERFGERLTVSMVANLKVKLGVKSGTHGGCFVKGQEPPNKGRPWSEWMPTESAENARRTQFKRGNLSGSAEKRKRPLLDIRESKDGYLQIKVAPRNAKNTMNNWISLAQFVWMQANGSDWPDGHRCLFADRDNRNFDPENLVPIPNELYPLVQGPLGLPYYDRESLEVAITYAKMLRAKVAAERRGKNG